jgi:transcriptional repressor NF-X1
VDVEPQRRYSFFIPETLGCLCYSISVELIRRIDTRIPVPLLSAITQQAMTSPTSLGKLQTKASTSATSSPARATLLLSSSGSTGRAWAAVASSSRTSPAQPPFVPLPGQNSSKSTPTRPSARLIENDARVPADWEADD